MELRTVPLAGKLASVATRTADPGIRIPELGPDIDIADHGGSLAVNANRVHDGVHLQGSEVDRKPAAPYEPRPASRFPFRLLKLVLKFSSTLLVEAS
jgi:hypothetical protein